MKNAFESCKMMGVVDGSKMIPPDDSANIVKHWIWKKKDNLMKAMIMQCVKSDLVIKVAHTKPPVKPLYAFLLEVVLESFTPSK